MAIGSVESSAILIFICLPHRNRHMCFLHHRYRSFLPLPPTQNIIVLLESGKINRSITARKLIKRALHVVEISGECAMVFRRPHPGGGYQNRRHRSLRASRLCSTFRKLCRAQSCFPHSGVRHICQAWRSTRSLICGGRGCCWR